VKPFTVMSCDNLPGNGHVTKAAVMGLAGLSDPDLADWIATMSPFRTAWSTASPPPPAPVNGPWPPASALGDDPVPVTCEPFRQWVLEDNFPAGRPAFEKVGVTFTPHVHAFEMMKIRILNGGHATIAYPGGLMDVEFVHEAMANPLILGLLNKVETEEIIPYIPPVPDTDLATITA
jgi:mannitol 2-dehydrogenase